MRHTRQVQAPVDVKHRIEAILFAPTLEGVCVLEACPKLTMLAPDTLICDEEGLWVVEVAADLLLRRQDSTLMVAAKRRHPDSILILHSVFLPRAHVG